MVSALGEISTFQHSQAGMQAPTGSASARRP
jgi:hypothetical protein